MNFTAKIIVIAVLLIVGLWLMRLAWTVFRMDKTEFSKNHSRTSSLRSVVLGEGISRHEGVGDTRMIAGFLVRKPKGEDSLVVIPQARLTTDALRRPIR